MNRIEEKKNLKNQQARVLFANMFFFFKHIHENSLASYAALFTLLPLYLLKNTLIFLFFLHLLSLSPTPHHSQPFHLQPPSPRTSSFPTHTLPPHSFHHRLTLPCLDLQ